jgi:tetratricopeptide (TPR) repeat protein
VFEMSARRALFGLAAAIVLTGMPVRAQGQAPSASASAAATPAAGLSAGELDAMLVPLAHDVPDDRRAAATAIVALGDEATASITRKLADLRKGGDGGAFNAVKSTRDRAGKDFDLLEALLLAKPEAGTTRALTMTCLLRALGHAGTTAAVRQLVQMASDAGGVFRPELTRQMKQLGDRAVAALIEAKRDPTAETRTWASNLLEAMNKRMPGEAVQTKDNQALSDVLHAYASVKDLEALPVVLSFVNSDRAQVRAAARDASLAYGQDGLWKLREAYATLTGEPAPEGIAAVDLAKKLFDAYDRFRLADVYTLVDRALGEQKAGKLDTAVTDFDEALARQPMLDRRAEAAPAYFAYGESLEDTDRPRALAYLRRSLRVDEAGPQSSLARSEIAYLEGEDLLSRGVTDPEPFERALVLDPNNAHARAALDRLRASAEAGRVRSWRVIAAVVLLLVAVAGIVLAGNRRRLSARLS